MNASRFAVGLVSLSIAGLWYFAGGMNPLPISQAAETPRVTQPLTHENLTVYFVYGTDSVPDAKVMTLKEALEQKLAVINETSDVNMLSVENKSPDCELFIQSGDIVKGGKQDRMAATDMLLPPKSGVVQLPAHCVEQGRWTGRGSEDSQKFTSSDKCAVGNEMKIANYSGQQPVVWQTVKSNQVRLQDNLKTSVNADASPTSFQLTLETAPVKEKAAAYEASLKAAGEGRGDIIGVVFVVNGQITSAEVYGSNAIFRKAWPKLLNAAAADAIAKRDKPANDPPSAREVEYFLARAAEPEPADVEENTRQARAATTGIARARQRLHSDDDEPGLDSNLEAALPNVQRRGRTPILPPEREGAGLPQVQYNATSNRGEPDRVGRVIIEGNNVTGDRVILNRLDLRPGQPATPAYVQRLDRALSRNPNPGGGQWGLVNDNVAVGNRGRVPATASPDGNRLNSNFNDNRGSLMVESRDPNRQNAVIHRSYLKK